MNSEPCCKNCVFSRWFLTPKGRISNSPDTLGVCVVDIPKQPLPSCVTEAYGFVEERKRSRIRKDMGKDCPLYQENLGKPQHIE